ncbi:hypothetical protein Leryth_027394 [Lithospermum erythrorhizon]|nr:hypothetical protein Leryth_027394 [Lithospermum erythrorhizon]
MSSVTNISPSIKPLHRFSSPINLTQNQLMLKIPNLNSEKLGLIKRRAVASFSEEAASVSQSDNSPFSIQLHPISTEDQFNRVVHQAHQYVVIVCTNNVDE